MSHARLSPSNKLWVHCPGFVNLDLPETPAREAAIEGVGVHLLIEMCYLQNKQPSDFLDQQIGIGHPEKPRGWKVTQARIDSAEYMIAYTTVRVRETGATLEPESKSNPGEKFGRDDWYGTADVTLRREGFLEVIDYKNGRTYVDVRDNSQLISYGYGKWNGEENVRLTIVQPKTGQKIRSIDITGLELKQKAEELNEAAKLTDDPNAPLISGDWCDKHWCPNREECVEYNKTATDVIEDEMVETYFNELITNLSSMTDVKLGRILDSKKVFERLFEKAEAEAELRISNGKKVNGWEMAEGRKGSRKWADEAEVIKYLKKKKVKKADYIKETLLTPNQLGDIVEGLDDFITIPDGKLKLTQVKKIKF